MIYHGFKVSATPGTAVPLATTRYPAAFITIYARTSNAGEVRVGGNPANATNAALNGASAAISPGSGMPLRVGDAGVAWPISAPGAYDLQTIYFDVDTSGDGVQFIFGR